MSKPVSRVSNAFVPGPLAEFAGGVRQWLLEQGYTPLTTVPQLQLMAHVSRWLDRGGLAAGRLAIGQAERFLAAHHAAGYQRPKSLAGLRPLLDYLGGLGVLPPEPPEPPPDGARALVSAFAEYLRAERGLAPVTVAAYSSRAGRFVARCAPDGDPGVITPADVMAAVLEEASGLSAGAGQHLAAALRAFLRYCHVQGLVAADVSAAAMAVTGRRTSLLPRGLDPGQVAALLGACDRGEPAGRRDYAVILLLARLGLRGGEADRLPLPADAGAAIAAWLRDGRPAVAFREVFTTVIAPVRPLTREAVGCIVRRTAVRAGLPAFGAHRLRHTAACAMVGARVPLAGIGQVLRHRNLTVTAGYARVDLARLRPLARPWPGASAAPEGEAR